MPAATHTYDPANHIIVFGPIILDSGFGPDEFISVKPEASAWEDEVGVDGEVTRSKNNDKRHTVTLTLMQTSKKNDLLSAYYNTDRLMPGGLGAKPFLLQDRGGTTVIFAEEAWLQKAPDQTRGKKAGTVVWEIRLASVIPVHGGND